MRPAREILISLGVYLYTCDDLPTFSAPHILLPEPDLPCPPFLADAFLGVKAFKLELEQNSGHRPTVLRLADSRLDSGCLGPATSLHA